MKKQLEKPYEYLKRKDGTAFSTEIVKHWYEARVYVLDKLKDVVIGPDSGESLHVVLTSDSSLMLCVARQFALLCHFANFDDSKVGNRTLITIVSQNKQIFEELVMEEYLCNLPYHCNRTLFGTKVENNDNYTDIELEVVEKWDGKDGAMVLSEEDVKAFLSSKSEEEIYSIDTRKAVIADRIYSVGTLIDNLPAEDIHSPSRYAMALDAFQYRLLREDITPLVNPKKWANDLTRVKNGISNISCTDCFETRMKCITEEQTEAYSKSEHARWLTEKLIMGFRPLTKTERIHDERLFSSDKSNFRKQLKKKASDPVHIDICDYADLRRIDPDSLKYDTFLMLAIPMIQKSIR